MSEFLPTTSKGINMRGFKGSGAVAGEITIAEIISHDDDDVWLLHRERKNCGAEEKGAEECFHFVVYAMPDLDSSGKFISRLGSKIRRARLKKWIQSHKQPSEEWWEN